jgi:hypothetical protein
MSDPAAIYPVMAQNVPSPKPLKIRPFCRPDAQDLLDTGMAGAQDLRTFPLDLKAKFTLLSVSVSQRNRPSQLAR